MFFFVFDKLEPFDYRCGIFPRVDFGCCYYVFVYSVEDRFADPRGILETLLNSANILGISRTTTLLTPFHGKIYPRPNHAIAPTKDQLVPVREVYYNLSTRTFHAEQKKRTRVLMPTQKQSAITLQLTIP